MAAYDVKLYVYDLSNGLARSLSPMLLGRQIDGVWHTAIVVYDQEFYFGGMGIEACTPGCTILGQPQEAVSLGSTEIPFDMFMDHLQELSQSTFRPQDYHLLNHNCNTFSDEVAQFLTGRKIPSHITSLPQEVLQTPFGAMIKPFIDSMSVTPTGGHALVNNTNQAAPQAISSAVVVAALPPVATHDDRSMLSKYSENREFLAVHLPENDMKLLDEACEYVTSAASSDWSLRPLHIKTLCRAVNHCDISVDIRVVLSTILQMALLHDDIITVCCHDPDQSLIEVLRNILELTDQRLLLSIAKCACNFASSKVGAEKLVQAATLLTKISHALMLNELCDLRLIGSQITSNVLRNVQKVSEDMAFDFGVTLVEACQKTDDKTAEYLWFSLCSCIRINNELADLAVATGLDVVESERKFPVIIRYLSDVKKYFL